MLFSGRTEHTAQGWSRDVMDEVVDELRMRCATREKY
jgi:hypothetical protein